MDNWLDIKNLYLEYIGGYVALNDISISMSQGECAVIYGEDASGKTSLLRAIAGLDVCQKGSMFIGGKKIEDILPRDKNFAFSFDESIFSRNDNVFDIIAYPMKLRKMSEQEIDKRTKDAALTFDLNLQTKVSQLSALQKALLILARMFSIERKLYLLDDLTKNLDNEDKSIIQKMVKECIKSKSVIIATSDKDFAKSLDSKVMVLSNGNGVLRDIKDMSEYPMNMQEASFCDYELHTSYLEKQDNEYYCQLFDKKWVVDRPLSDIYLDKEVCFAVKQNYVYNFYFDMTNQRLISNNTKLTIM